MSDYPADWTDFRHRALERDGYRCRNCGGKENLNVHHIVPLSRGGTNHLDNLVTLCERCHIGVEPHVANLHRSGNHSRHSGGWSPLFVLSFAILGGGILLLSVGAAANPFPVPSLPDSSIQQCCPEAYRQALDFINQANSSNAEWRAITWVSVFGGLMGVVVSALSSRMTKMTKAESDGIMSGSKNTSDLKCPKCGISFDSNEALIKHAKRTHQDDDDFQELFASFMLLDQWGWFE